MSATCFVPVDLVFWKILIPCMHTTLNMPDRNPCDWLHRMLYMSRTALSAYLRLNSYLRNHVWCSVNTTIRCYVLCCCERLIGTTLEIRSPGGDVKDNQTCMNMRFMVIKSASVALEHHRVAKESLLVHGVIVISSVLPQLRVML